MKSSRAELPAAAVAMMQRHYRISDIAETWGVSHNFVLELFQDEPGIVRSPGKRSIVLVPATILERVYRRMQEAGSGR